jgi:hypothetical protein
MTRTALVSGSAERVAAVGAALAKCDCEVVAADDPDALIEVCASLGRNALDHYVQLPVDLPSEGNTVVARLQAFLAAGLLARFQAMSSVLPILRPNASVVLVAGNLPADITAPDDRQSRISLLRVLARAVLADMSPVTVRTVVVDHLQSPDRIAEIALDPTGTRLRVIANLADRYPDMSYDDWRLEVLNLTAIES